MRLLFISLSLLVSLLSATGARAQARWSVEAFGGSAVSLPMRLVIRQEGEEDIRLTARWTTRPLDDAPYYAVRVERREGGAGWALEFLHHKAYLENEPPEVTYFEVSHGYSQLTLQRVWERGPVALRAGGGIVLAHTESRVRGREFRHGGGLLGWGYRVRGAAAQAAAGRRFRLVGPLFVSAEAKATAAWARVQVADGTADVPNVALHGLAGVGASF
jgi:hypothetical protein